MPDSPIPYAFAGDYSQEASCLFSIQQLLDAGLLANDPEVLSLLDRLQRDLIRKLYQRVLKVLQRLNGDAVVTVGDFDYLDFAPGDFATSFIDPTNSGFSSLFQTALNVIQYLVTRRSELTGDEMTSIDTVLIPVLDLIDDLRAALDKADLNPCGSLSKRFINSEELHLQAAGSDGTGGIARGVHLRWAFNQNLGERHLPQGSLAQAAEGLYQQPEDFVQIFRTPYTQPITATFNLNLKPAIDLDRLQWTYSLSSAGNTTRLRMRFSDGDAYRQAALTTDPNADHEAFLVAYQGGIEMDFAGLTAFRLGLGYQGSQAMRLEIQSGTLADATPAIRRVVTASAEPVSFEAENIVLLHIHKPAGGAIASLSIETYDDFLRSKSDSDWTLVKALALTTSDQEAFDRLEDANRFQVDGQWPHYRGGKKVSVAVYHQEWLDQSEADPGIKATINRYVDLSAGDPRAVDTLASDTDADHPGIQVSYLDVLRLLALDYHRARMLGLGYIDTLPGDEKFVYMAVYTNRTDDTNPVPLKRRCLTLPVNDSPSAVPLAPDIRAVSYALPVESAEAARQFDPSGYAVHGRRRLINIGRKPFGAEVPLTEFLEDADPEVFDLYAHPQTVLYGIEYRRASESDYRNPDIITASFGDPLAATATVPDHPDSLFLHLEEESGEHAYALFGVSLLGRISPLSAEVLTDNTQFPLRNLLQAPQSLAVQYIQPEDPLLFTTQREQNWLAQRMARFPSGDTAFTRLTFDWVDVIDVTDMDTSHGYADIPRAEQLEVRFHPGEPLQTAGLISAVIPVDGTASELLIRTSGYTRLDDVSVTPAIAAGDFPLFTGSLLITPEGQFRVLEVTAGSQGPQFRIERFAQTVSEEDPDVPGLLGLRTVYSQPLSGSRFTIMQNLSQVEAWQGLTKTVPLYSLADAANPVIKIKGESNSAVRLWAGGLNTGAHVIPLRDVTTQEILPGYYQLSLPQTLAAHPQQHLPFDPAAPDACAPGQLQPPHVEWYKGKVLIDGLALDGGGTTDKVLDVVQIVQTDPVMLYVYDPDAASAPLPLSADETDYSLEVNFHPGYQVYLYAEPAAGAFNAATLMPPAGKLAGKTMITSRSVTGPTSTVSQVSGFAAPVFLMSRFLIVPEKPDAPILLQRRVRPDATTKAALTFDLPVRKPATGPDPFAYQFYRISSQEILEALYQPATIVSIGTALAGKTGPDEDARWLELVNLDLNGAGEFSAWNAYTLPQPDHEKLGSPDDALDVRQDRYRQALRKAMLPLSSRTLQYGFLKTGKMTESRQPVIQNANGDLLSPSDERFDPFPMARKYEEGDERFIRFTDYTLNGFSRFTYYYAAAELNNQLSAGPISRFSGPVEIIQALAADEPVITSYTVDPAEGPAVSFELAPLPSHDPMAKVRIYRTLDASRTLLSDMTSYLDVTLGAAPGLITVTDDFSDLSLPPTGETIYYRLAGVRSIINEHDLAEDIVSVATAPVAIRLIDVANPAPPILDYDSATQTLSWSPTTNKGIYYLMKQNDRGNWQRIVAPIVNTNNLLMSVSVGSFLVSSDDEGNPAQNRFKVNVENTSGLFNLTAAEKTI